VDVAGWGIGPCVYKIDTLGWGTMNRARNNLAGQNEGDGGGGGGVRWIVYATSSRKITRVMGQQGVGYDG
jgi:hypothetical protein